MGYMNREIYPKVKVIMNQSIKEAKNFDDSKVRPEHIVLSMLITGLIFMSVSLSKSVEPTAEANIVSHIGTPVFIFNIDNAPPGLP